VVVATAPGHLLSDLQQLWLIFPECGRLINQLFTFVTIIFTLRRNTADSWSGGAHSALLFSPEEH
jgi:hypothetical protein